MSRGRWRAAQALLRPERRGFSRASAQRADGGCIAARGAQAMEIAARSLRRPGGATSSGFAINTPASKDCAGRSGLLGARPGAEHAGREWVAQYRAEVMEGSPRAAALAGKVPQARHSGMCRGLGAQAEGQSGEQRECTHSQVTGGSRHAAPTHPRPHGAHAPVDYIPAQSMHPNLPARVCAPTGALVPGGTANATSVLPHPRRVHSLLVGHRGRAVCTVRQRRRRRLVQRAARQRALRRARHGRGPSSWALKSAPASREGARQGRLCAGVVQSQHDATPMSTRRGHLAGMPAVYECTALAGTPCRAPTIGNHWAGAEAATAAAGRQGRAGAPPQALQRAGLSGRRP